MSGIFVGDPSGAHPPLQPALMAYFQQALTKLTPTTRANFQSQIRHFLDDNAWFDDCLAVRMATETRQWDLLGHVARTRKAK